MAQSRAFISLKNHKENFKNNPKCRLINPAKNNLGLLSKQVLDRINNNIRSKTNSNQWRNTKSVIDWFSNIREKKHSFLPYAMQFTTVSDEDVEINTHSRKTLLFDENETWIKRCHSLMFNVPVGCYDRAEVCELVGLFTLSKLSSEFPNDGIGLYRDDGLAVLKNINARSADKARKVFCNLGLSTLGAREPVPGHWHKMALCSHFEYIATPFRPVRRHFET